MTLLGEWSALSKPWQLAFSQAWLAYQDDCCPVGAIVVDDAGAVVSQARNRVNAMMTTSRELTNTKIAHAGINALAQIPAVTQHAAHAIYMTIEPCVMCMGSIAIQRISTVYFAAGDFYAGASAQVPEIPSAADFWPTVKGPYSSEIAEIFTRLYIAFHSSINPGGPLSQAYRAALPDEYGQAERLASFLDRDREARNSPLVDVLDALFAIA